MQQQDLQPVSTSDAAATQPPLAVPAPPSLTHAQHRKTSFALTSCWRWRWRSSASATARCAFSFASLSSLAAPSSLPAAQEHIQQGAVKGPPWLPCTGLCCSALRAGPIHLAVHSRTIINHQVSHGNPPPSLSTFDVVQIDAQSPDSSACCCRAQAQSVAAFSA